MPRIARIIASGFPHHIIQRGNRRQRTFFSDDDYAAYAYCLMPNHVHLIVVPQTADNLRLAIGEAHRRYTRMINFREGWRGHLWQGRFASYVLVESYLIACVRYIEMNSVRAGLVSRPEEWRWSSTSAHINKKDDRLVKVAPLLQMITGDWNKFLASGPASKDAELKKHERAGRPLGSEIFLNHLEKTLDCRLKPRKPGPKPKKGLA